MEEITENQFVSIVGSGGQFFVTRKNKIGQVSIYYVHYNREISKEVCNALNSCNTVGAQTVLLERLALGGKL